MGGIWSLLWIFSISPEMSGFYWQFGWYWNIFREITSNHFKLLFPFEYWQTKIEMDGIWCLIWIFSIAPEMSGFYWQFGWYWNIFREITSNHFKLLFPFEYWQTKIEMDGIWCLIWIFSISPEMSGF